MYSNGRWRWESWKRSEFESTKEASLTITAKVIAVGSRADFVQTASRKVMLEKYSTIAVLLLKWKQILYILTHEKKPVLMKKKITISISECHKILVIITKYNCTYEELK